MNTFQLEFSLAVWIVLFLYSGIVEGVESLWDTIECHLQDHYPVGRIEMMLADEVVAAVDYPTEAASEVSIRKPPKLQR